MMYKLYIYIYTNQICSAVSGKKRKRKKNILTEYIIMDWDHAWSCLDPRDTHGVC